MQYFKGTTTVRRTKMMDADRNIRYFVITNKSLATVTVNVKIKLAGGIEINVSPMNLQLIQGTSYTDNDLALEQDEEIIVEVQGGQIDYYFLIEDFNESYLRQW